MSRLEPANRANISRRLKCEKMSEVGNFCEPVTSLVLHPLPLGSNEIMALAGILDLVFESKRIKS